MRFESSIILISPSIAMAPSEYVAEAPLNDITLYNPGLKFTVLSEDG